MLRNQCREPARESGRLENPRSESPRTSGRTAPHAEGNPNRRMIRQLPLVHPLGQLCSDGVRGQAACEPRRRTQIDPIYPCERASPSGGGGGVVRRASGADVDGCGEQRSKGTRVGAKLRGPSGTPGCREVRGDVPRS